MKIITQNSIAGNHYLLKFYRELQNANFKSISIKNERIKCFVSCWRMAYQNLEPLVKNDPKKRYLLNQIYAHSVMQMSGYWFDEHENHFTMALAFTYRNLTNWHQRLEEKQPFNLEGYNIPYSQTS